MTTTLKLRSSVYPENKPSFNEWCETFKVSTRIPKDRSPLINAQRIMELWNGFHNMKEKFIKPIKVEEF